MTSPDFREYIDLTIYDTTPQDLYDEAVVYAQTALPEFEPRLGMVEDAILQSMAYVGALIAVSINRLPNGIMEAVLRLQGFQRNEATFATGTALFTVSVNTGVVIPADTAIAYVQFVDGLVTTYTFVTDVDLVIASGSDSGSVAITALSAGKYPSLLDNQGLTLISQVPYVLAIELTADLSTGADAETDAAFFDRGSQYFSSLNTTIATSTQMTNYIRTNYSTVPILKVYDLLDGTGNMLFATAPAEGEVTIAVCDTDGTALTSPIKTGLQADVADRATAGLDITVVDMKKFTVFVTCEIATLDGFVPQEVVDSAEVAVENYLSFSGWDFTQTVNKNILIANISQVAGVKYVSSLSITTTTTAGGFVIGNSYTIATAGTTTFTSVGAANSTPGTIFTATGVGAGTGTATATFTEAETVSSVATGNITILRAGLVPTGTASITAI